MALAWDCGKARGLVVGSEAKLVVVGGGLEEVVGSSLDVMGERGVINPGMGVVRVRPDSRMAVTGGWDGRVRVFSWKNPEKVKPLAVLQFHSESVECMAFSGRLGEGGKLGGRRGVLAAGSKDGKVSLWDVYSDT